MLEDLIKKYLVETAGVDPIKFENPALTVADLELDSLALVEMLFEVEDEFGFQVPDPLIFLTMSYADMVAHIADMVRSHKEGKSLVAEQLVAPK